MVGQGRRGFGSHRGDHAGGLAEERDLSGVGLDQGEVDVGGEDPEGESGESRAGAQVEHGGASFEWGSGSGNQAGSGIGFKFQVSSFRGGRTTFGVRRAVFGGTVVHFMGSRRLAIVQSGSGRQTGGGRSFEFRVASFNSLESTCGAWRRGRSGSSVHLAGSGGLGIVEMDPGAGRGGWEKVAGGKQGFAEVAGDDLLGVADGGEVNTSVPAQQKVEIGRDLLKQDGLKGRVQKWLEELGDADAVHERQG